MPTYGNHIYFEREPLVQPTVCIGTVTPFESPNSLHPERTDTDSITHLMV
jgi:hypothetical protein